MSLPKIPDMTSFALATTQSYYKDEHGGAGCSPKVQSVTEVTQTDPGAQGTGTVQQSQPSSHPATIQPFIGSRPSWGLERFKAENMVVLLVRGIRAGGGGSEKVLLG